jgi:hypothetical protein
MTGAIDRLAQRVRDSSAPKVAVPQCEFKEFLDRHARVRLRNGSYAEYTFSGRRPLVYVAELLDKILANTTRGQAVTVDGNEYAPGEMRGSTVSVCGGAQFGKTVLELNLGGWLTTCKFLNFGYYTSDRELLATIVDTKFRPDVVDQIPWMIDLIDIGKAENKHGRSVNRKNAYQVSSGDRKAFGYFNGMQKPPTTITLDVAVLDEVDDIPERNIGYVAGRMTNSDVALTCFIGTQRIHAAGQNARWQAGTMHRWITPCHNCGAEICLEEHWPNCCYVAAEGRAPQPVDETMQFDPGALYYAACPDCHASLDSDLGSYVAERPERAKTLNWSIRIAQMDVPALPWRDIAASWLSALRDPNPEAMVAWHCDRRAIPNAGAQQPITPQVIQRSRARGLGDSNEPQSEGKPYSMALGPGEGHPRFAGMDTGPRCWIWVNERRGPLAAPLIWAEMIPSTSVYERISDLQHVLGIQVLAIDAGGEPDLTKRLALSLNGLETYQPPVAPPSDLRKMVLHNIGAGLTWDGHRGQWRNIKCCAVLFSLREAGGIVHDIGITQDGRIYPLIKCNRGETIQGAVNSLLTPSDGVAEQIDLEGEHVLRMHPRQRLPENAIGRGVTPSILDGHLQNLRKIKKPGGAEEWADSVENHLGLSLAYARIAERVGAMARPVEIRHTIVERATRPRGRDSRGIVG